MRYSKRRYLRAQCLRGAHVYPIGYPKFLQRDGRGALWRAVIEHILQTVRKKNPLEGGETSGPLEGKRPSGGSASRTPREGNHPSEGSKIIGLWRGDNPPEE